MQYTAVASAMGSNNIAHCAACLESALDHHLSAQHALHKAFPAQRQQTASSRCVLHGTSRLHDAPCMASQCHGNASSCWCVSLWHFCSLSLLGCPDHSSLSERTVLCRGMHSLLRGLADVTGSVMHVVEHVPSSQDPMRGIVQMYTFGPSLRGKGQPDISLLLVAGFCQPLQEAGPAKQ